MVRLDEFKWRNNGTGGWTEIVEDGGNEGGGMCGVVMIDKKSTQEYMKRLGNESRSAVVRCGR